MLAAMSAYRTIVVGTDGSDTSYRAVDRAAAVAADSDALLVIVTAYEPEPVDQRDIDTLGSDAYQIVGSSPAESVVRQGQDRAVAAGARHVETEAVQGKPVDVLRDVAEVRKADLLVVGSVGLNTLAGRILGSVPADVARRAGIDVLIVHTT
jgi:nucleotide-binding universal stress UspA family protein